MWKVPFKKCMKVVYELLECEIHIFSLPPKSWIGNVCQSCL
jgi:hypothetical protein